MIIAKNLKKRVLFFLLLASASASWAQDNLNLSVVNHSEIIDAYLEYLSSQIHQIREPDMADLAVRRLNPRTPNPLPPGSPIPIFARDNSRWSDPHFQDSIDEVTGRNNTLEGLFDQRRRSIAEKSVTDREKKWAIKEAFRIITLEIHRIQGKHSFNKNQDLSRLLQSLEERFKFGAERIAHDLMTQTQGPISDGLNRMDKLWFHSELKAARNRLILEWYLAKISGLLGRQLDYAQFSELQTGKPVPLGVFNLRGAMLLALAMIPIPGGVSDEDILDGANRLGEESFYPGSLCNQLFGR